MNNASKSANYFGIWKFVQTSASTYSFLVHSCEQSICLEDLGSSWVRKAALDVLVHGENILELCQRLAGNFR
jgi:hypothetical protein